ncbi:MAG: 16S rRNA (cytosine(1402)-N(4))-methyltransferase RsmH [Parachlamydiales bacterium]
MTHIPVLLNEVVEAFRPVELLTFVDGTIGAGGHAEAIARAHPELKRLIGFDQDPVARRMATERLSFLGERLVLEAQNFRRVGELEGEIDGLLLDIGVSSMQLDTAERGMSFSKEGPLDMRMDPEGGLTAAAIVNGWSADELERLFREYGEVKGARRFAKTICEARGRRRLETTTDLVRLLSPLVPFRGKTHPLTQVFQALRIAVNDELGALQEGLEGGIAKLRAGGRMAVITFHSLEDRIVKQKFKEESESWLHDPTVATGRREKTPRLRIVTKKPIEAGREEVRGNPRSRSAKLRIAERV